MREEVSLSDALASCREPSLPALFVVAATFLEGERLRACENELVRRMKLGRNLTPRPFDTQECRNPLAACQARLGVDSESRESRELVLVKSLDATLKSFAASLVGARTYLGYDGRPYWVCPRNPWLAERFPTGPSAADLQSPTLATYCVHHMVVAGEPIDGVRIVPKRREAWGTPELHDAIHARRAELTVLVRPFGCGVAYRSLVPADGEETILLDAITNEDALRAEVDHALDESHQRRADLLVFPELCFSASMLMHLVDRLRHASEDPWPLLTVVGMCHRPESGERSALNEALLLGPYGSIVATHRKLTRFALERSRRGDVPLTFAEATRTGDELLVLECDAGNIALPICLDLFQLPARHALERSHANLLLVPSLSRRTEPHREAASALARSNRATTVVCNQPLPSDAIDARSTSFVHRPGGSPFLVLHCPAGGPPGAGLLARLTPDG